ncbi:ABC transporter-related protein [Chloroherpeton thalassium ATCC 35110]|uniref:ABC transporter-related protein n=1 Tax=Chloroherpeton thalassium (strain ATCC 35110 / GB-78) TaxID=517418 RepID=B3QXQ2_CHLT3|nr:ABC transporter ATP-binding protein [Chloroherpeton thalassium]ACF14967.1 ABC transporter-related protein [Chloroherpeton thalassium ATCC 35110]
MSNIAIKVENISKLYHIGVKDSGNLRDSLVYGVKRLFNKEQNNHADEFWALKDVSFDVKHGEVVGIIGRNGAGKSTLLKILSRITEPTSGRIEINGRVASLLEVGTGFHPELTGRENIFMNGSILGMKQAEIRKKFDEIVDFSGVEKFIDTPVKHYSSGMYVRLAFAVAAHLEPEILIIDEVLAVGDSVFQQRCIEKMTEVSKCGRTVLFVSHSMPAVKQLCNRGIVLVHGQKSFEGSTEGAVSFYMNETKLSGKIIDLEQVKRLNGTQSLIFKQISFIHYPIEFGQNIKFKIKLKRKCDEQSIKDLDFGVAIKDKNGSYLIHCSNRFINVYIEHDSDVHEYVFDIQNFLKPSKYYITLFLRAEDIIQDWLPDVCSFEVEDGNPYGYNATKNIKGCVLPAFNIKKEFLKCGSV